MLDADREEIVATIERVQTTLEDISVRGLRAASPEQLAGLQSFLDEFRRIGASHLAERMSLLLSAARNDDPSAAGALLRAQTSVRLFERVLTLEVAHEALTVWNDALHPRKMGLELDFVEEDEL